MARLLPSRDQRKLRICSESKAVICRRAELPLSGCTQRLSTPFSRIEYAIAFPSGEKFRTPLEIRSSASISRVFDSFVDNSRSAILYSGYGSLVVGSVAKT